ncbi:MAG TPA: sugar phosphate isomerase/epimerase family protein [Bryobacteraceae bacterium]|nr:sugar phosphate isomerase/epimerase family protein [Bryobacteraceae bacterium]
MLKRRDLLLSAPVLAAAAEVKKWPLCMHQTTSLQAGFRKSLEGYSKAGIRFVEVIPAHVDEFAKKESLGAAKRLMADLGIKAVSSGGVRGLAEPNPDRAKALEELKYRAERVAELGVDRMVCPCGTSAKFTLDDYKRGVDNLRQVGDIVKGFQVVAMVEFMRGSTFIGSLPTSLKMTREANHPFLKPMFDFYHFGAGLSRLEDLDLIRAGELHHVHFQDVPDIPRELLDNGTRDIPGDGVLPLARILHGIRKARYEGPLSVELFYPRLQQGDPYEVAMEIRRKSEAVLKKAGMF